MVKDNNQDLTQGEKLPRVGFVDTMFLSGKTHTVYNCEYSLYYSFKNPPVKKVSADFFAAKIKGKVTISEAMCLN